MGFARNLALLVVLTMRSLCSLRQASRHIHSRAWGDLRLLAVRRSKGTDAAAGDSPPPPPQPPSVPKLRITRRKANPTPPAASEAAGDINSKKSNFVTMRLGTEQDEQNADMEERMREARNWVSKKLSDEDSAMLNRAMGIEEEVMAALAEQEEGDERKASSKTGRSAKSQQGQGKGRDGRDSPSGKVRKLQMLHADDERAHIRGFLEMNPYLCSGCGAPFQSKTADAPGFLPTDKMQAHRAKSLQIREQQDAVRTLELAGLEVDSAAAEELLREAGVAEHIIAGVQALGGRTFSSASSSLDASTKAGPRKGRAERWPGAALAAAGDERSSAVESDEDEEEDEEGEEEDVLDGMEIDLDLEAMLSGVKEEQGVDQGAAFASALAVQIARAEAKARGTKPRITATPTIAVNLPESSPSLPSSSASSPLADPVCICQRCFRLKQYGQVEQVLRPGWSDHELLTAARFESLLGVIREEDAVVLCIIDLFDIEGSLLPNLKAIAGNNPIVVAANKLDLFPRDASTTRITSWVHSEVKRVCDLSSPKEKERDRAAESEAEAEGMGGSGGKFGGYRGRTASQKADLEAEAGVLKRDNVHLISSQTGTGVTKLIRSVMDLAEQHGRKIYVMGAANVGKSSFINRMLDASYARGGAKGAGKGDPRSRANNVVPQATVSNLPGTTLDFLKIRLPNGITMIDTPGLLNAGQLTGRLATEELRAVIPAKPVNAVTLRVAEGKCVLIGGLARIELAEVSFYLFIY